MHYCKDMTKCKICKNELKKMKEEVKKKKQSKIKCNDCGKDCNHEEDILFFHSKCCGTHFEGIMDIDGDIVIACEKCGKYVATVAGQDPKKVKNIYKI